MKTNTCLVVDVWEGNPDADLDAMKVAGVAGASIRLNDMAGGHHMDAAFAALWQRAGEAGLVRWPYFVYNPWDDGAENYAWLAANMPAEATAVALDVEVLMTGYDPKTYAGEVVKLYNACVAKGWRVMIYTAQWFLPYLSSWPRCDYWWAQYPNTTKINTCKSWAELQAACDDLVKPLNAGVIPGRLVMWQFSGDKLKLEGSGGHALDVNLFYGTGEELAAYIQSATGGGPGPVVPQVMRVKDDLECSLEGGKHDRAAFRNPGLPSTVPMHGPKSTVRLTGPWFNFFMKLNPGQENYLTRDNSGASGGSGWHNAGDPEVERTLTFSGNIVPVTRVDGSSVFVKTYNVNSDTPPALIRPSVADLRLPLQYFTTQYPWGLDWSTSGRWPIIFLVSDGGEYAIDISNLAPYTITNKVVKVMIPWLNVRCLPLAQSKAVGWKLYGQQVMIYGVTTALGNTWGRIGVDQWIALRYNGQFYTDWRG